ncbi:hypothetical protein Vadar_014951 [Vaccinium darrowii]|uniref:Uncharacterized protein n=1 Tax=Vaccinium darrowii TaxID=229202 RepID=A0ACB7XS14_9ERIC|nr:hypothetical protein Vadar_014951 [Vaccinium darrowii]
MEKGRNSSSYIGIEEKKKVMVAIEESECSHYALEWALQNLGNSIANAHLFIFTVQPNPDDTCMYMPTDVARSFQENQKKFSLAVLEKAKEICSKYGISAETMTEVGNPKEVICEAVEKFHIQLLVLGSHSRGALKRAFLGSVSNYCAHHAKCQVVVVKKPV